MKEEESGWRFYRGESRRRRRKERVDLREGWERKGEDVGGGHLSSPSLTPRFIIGSCNLAIKNHPTTTQLYIYK